MKNNLTKIQGQHYEFKHIHAQNLGNANIKVLYQSLSKIRVHIQRVVFISWVITSRLAIFHQTEQRQPRKAHWIRIPFLPLFPGETRRNRKKKPTNPKPEKGLLKINTLYAKVENFVSKDFIQEVHGTSCSTKYHLKTLLCTLFKTDTNIQL